MENSASISEVITLLKEIRFMTTPEECIVFDNTVITLAAKPMEQVGPYLEELFVVLDDKTHHHEVMWTLLLYLEDFEMSWFLPAFGAVLPALITQAPEWTDILIHRILSSEIVWQELANVFPILSQEQQNNIRTLLIPIATANKERAEQIQPLLT